jgi:hypothetical protein
MRKGEFRFGFVLLRILLDLTREQDDVSAPFEVIIFQNSTSCTCTYRDSNTNPPVSGAKLPSNNLHLTHLEQQEITARYRTPVLA